MPQKICYLDAFSGVSGDMLVGALADAGADPGALVRGLDSLGTGARVRFEQVQRAGVAAVKFHVEGVEQSGHRHLGPILEMIERSSLAERVKRDASAVFRRLGEAEAAVHQVPVDKVHFHEVGAVDSIADIVGASLGFDLLGVDRIVCSPVNVGSGAVESEHGLLPVPAPATARLLEGRPIYARGPAVELTTPTGAAVVTALAQDFGPMPAMKLTASGYGAGSRDFAGQPNVLRVLLGETSAAAEATEICVLEANIDDASPQILGYAMERLLERGALDVTLQPVEMKKGRAGTLLRVLARPEDRETMAELIFAETTTLGLRLYAAERRVQPRRWVEVATPHGTVRMKVAGDGAWAPEYEDCRRLALQTGTPLKQVIAEANFAYLKSIR